MRPYPYSYYRGTAWDAVKSPAYQFSNGSRTATMASVVGASYLELIGRFARGNAKRKFLIHMDGSSNWNSNFSVIGILDLFTQISAPGIDTHGIGYGQQTGGASYNNAPIAGWAGSPYDTGDSIGVYIDFTTMKLYFDKNGTYQSGGNPATGVGGIAIPFGPAIFPGAAMYLVNAGDIGKGMTLHTLPSQVGSLPSGWIAWDS